MKIVVYTAIIGGYDTLNEPLIKPDGVDFVCFTDRDIKSDTWEIHKVIPLYKDNTRTARKYKVLPHRFVSEYDYSVWIDGNFVVIGDFRQLIDDSVMKVYDHTSCYDLRNCVYEEANAIFRLGQEPGKKFKDNPFTIKSQMERYISDGYPQNNGLLSSGVLFRKHNDSDVIKTMENWWTEIKYGSKRDQLSFNYVSWKNKFEFKYIHKDVRHNEHFDMKKHNK
jgi:hypothetical protein